MSPGLSAMDASVCVMPCPLVISVASNNDLETLCVQDHFYRQYENPLPSPSVLIHSVSAARSSSLSRSRFSRFPSFWCRQATNRTALFAWRAGNADS